MLRCPLRRFTAPLIDVETSGFKHLTRDQVQVEVQSAVRMDAALQVGDVRQVVEVTAETQLLQTETSSLCQVVESRMVQQMPLNGRNVLNLVTLVPGVVAQGQSMGNPTNTNISAWGNYQIGGGLGNQSAAYLDGAPLNTAYNNGVMLVPTRFRNFECRPTIWVRSLAASRAEW